MPQDPRRWTLRSRPPSRQTRLGTAGGYRDCEGCNSDSSSSSRAGRR